MARFTSVKMIVTHELWKGLVWLTRFFFFLVVGITRVQSSWACDLSLLVVWRPGLFIFNSHESLCEFYSMSCLHVVTCVRIENIYYVFYALFPISHGGRSHRCGTQYYVRNTYFVSNGQGRLWYESKWESKWGLRSSSRKRFPNFGQ